MKQNTKQKTKSDDDVKREMGERTIFFFDAVLAIAITLLVLDIPVKGFADFEADEFHELFVSFTAFFISFDVLAQIWILHSRIFSIPGFKQYCSPRENVELLFFVVLFPKATELLSNNSHSVVAITPFDGDAFFTSQMKDNSLERNAF